MANRYYLVATGNWSTQSNWDGGTFPTPSDIVYASGKTITIDTNINVDTITTALYPGGVTAGGSFVISTNTGLTITTNISAGTTTCLTTQHNSGTITIIGNVSASTTTTSSHGIVHSGLGRININGNVYGGSLVNYGISLTSTGGYNLVSCPSIYITGNTIGGSNSTTAYAITAGSTILCLIDVTGDCIAGTQSTSIQLSNQNSLLIVRRDLISTSGVSPFYGYNLKCSPSTNQRYIIKDTSSISADTIFTTLNYSSGIQNTYDVRSGVKYGYQSGFTGTMKIPPFSAVSVGISVDDGMGGVTYGTAITGIRDIGNMLGGYLG